MGVNKKMIVKREGGGGERWKVATHQQAASS